MPVYQGTYYAIAFTFYDADDVVIDITGWEFEADIKENRADEASLCNLTTANGGFLVTDGTNGRLEMRISAAQSEALPVGRMVFDVLRTDADPGPRYYFGGSFRVKNPVTNP